MKTVNRVEGGNGIGPPEELKEFAARMGWEADEWREYGLSTILTYDRNVDQFTFDWDNGFSVDKKVLRRADNLPSWVRRRYYVSGTVTSPLEQNNIHYCLVLEHDDRFVDYKPER